MRTTHNSTIVLSELLDHNLIMKRTNHVETTIQS